MSRVSRQWMHPIVCTFMLVLFLVARAPLVARAQSADETALRALAERFFAAYQRSDLDEIMSLWSENSSVRDKSKQAFHPSFVFNKIELKELAILKISTGNGRASVGVIANLIVTDAKSGKPSVGSGVTRCTLYCVKEGGVWKVWRYVSSEQELAVALATAKTNEERKAMIKAEKDLVTVGLVKELLAQGRDLYSQANYPMALNVFLLTIDVANQVADASGVAIALRAIGIVHASQGNYAEALSHYHESLKIAKEIPDKKAISRALINIGEVHRSQGNYVEALGFYHNGLKIAEEMGDEAVIAGAINNIGIVYRLQGNYTKAIEYYHNSLRMAERINDSQGVSSALNNIGIVYYLQGNFIRALEYYQKSLTLAEETKDNYVIARALVNIGKVHASQANYTQALEYHHRSLRVAREIGDKEIIAFTLSNFGIVQRLRNNFSQALEYFQESLKLAEEIGDKAGTATALSDMGEVHYLQGNFTQALERYQSSLKIAEAIGDKEGKANVLNNVAEVYLSQRNYSQAIEVAGRAAAIAQEVDLPEIFWRTRFTAGKAYLLLSRPVEARGEFDLAIASVEELRSRVAGAEEDRQRFFEDKLGPYHQMLELLVERMDTVEAFAYAERAKARALLDTLQTGKVSITKAMTEHEQELEQRLNSEIISLNSQIHHEKLRDRPDGSRLAQLDSRLERARLDYEAFNVSLYAAHPELTVHRGQMKPISLGGCGELITDIGTALLEYVVTQDKTYLFVLTGREQPKSASRPSISPPISNVYIINIKQKDLADRVQVFRKMLADTDIGFRKPARELYELLLKPAANQLRGKLRLVIVPEGPLWELPFQALQGVGGRYLIEHHSIAYAPSLTALNEMLKRRSKSSPGRGGPTLLAMGNPALSKPKGTGKQTPIEEKLALLPAAEKQVQALGQLYGNSQSSIYIGADASEERFKAEAPSCRVLHLATHGILNDRNPMYSYLVLSQAGSDREDGLLEAWELMKLELRADLAVLSACETARGRAAKGEGLIGLSWALFVAGVPTVVVSQWKVDSVSTGELMVEFHQRLRQNQHKSGPRLSEAKAMRWAALKLLRSRKQYSHPFYWAGFIVVGGGS